VGWTVRKKRIVAAALAVLLCLAVAGGWWWRHITSPAYRTRQAVAEIRAAMVDPNLARTDNAGGPPNWLARMSDPEWVLRQLGARAVPHLIEIIRSKDPYTCAAAGKGLCAAARGEDDIGPLLLPALADADAEVRRAAAEALGNTGAIDGRMVKALAEALGDEDRRVGTAAMEVLRGHLLRGHGGTVLPLAVRAARDRRPSARWNAALILGTASRRGSRVVPDLVRLLGDPHRNVRYAAAEALGNMGPAARSAEGALRRAAEDENSYVREAAVEALKRLRGRPTSAAAATTRPDGRQ